MKEKILELEEENQKLYLELQNLQILNLKEKLFNKSKQGEAFFEKNEISEQIKIIFDYFFHIYPKFFEEPQVDKSESEYKRNFEKIKLNEFSILTEEYDNFGIQGIKKILAETKIGPKYESLCWKAVYSHVSERDLRESRLLAWYVWSSYPVEKNLRWLIFKLYEADEIYFAFILLNLLPHASIFNEDESRKIKNIKDRVRVRQEFSEAESFYICSSLEKLKIKNRDFIKLNEKLRELCEENKDLLYMIKIKDAYLEKINNDYDSLKKFINVIKEHWNNI